MSGYEIGITGLADYLDRQARQTGRTESMLMQAEAWACRRPRTRKPVIIVVNELGFQHDLMRRINLRYPALREAGVRFVSAEQVVRPPLGSNRLEDAMYWDHAAIDKALRMIDIQRTYPPRQSDSDLLQRRINDIKRKVADA